MTTRTTICRSVVVLYLMFLALVTLQQFFIFSWTERAGLTLRLGLLGLLGWKAIYGSRKWRVGIGVLFALIAAVVAIQLSRHRHPGSVVLIRIGDAFASPVSAFCLFCVAPILSAFASWLLAREPNQPTEASSGIVKPGDDAPAAPIPPAAPQ